MKKKHNYFDKNYVINEQIIKEIKNLNLNIDEFVLIMFFINSDNKKLDLQNISDHTYFSDQDILSTINALVEKKLIEIVSKKDERGKFADYINLDGLDDYLNSLNDTKSVNNTKEDIYSIFEKEFGRTISSMEYEIINAWLEKGYSKDIIISALKEAVYNGVNNLRYIDKILFEWDKKGIKNKEDIDNYMKRKNTDKSKDDLFDYNWLEDDAE